MAAPRRPAKRLLEPVENWVWVALPSAAFLSISLGQILAGLAAAMWLAGYGRPARPRWPRGLTLAVGVFYAWIVLAALPAGSGHRSLMDSLGKWSPLLLLLLGAARAPSPPQVWRAVFLLAGVSAALLPWYVWTYTHWFVGRAGAFSGGSPNLGTDLMMAALVLLPAVLALRGRLRNLLAGAVAAQLAGLTLTINRAAALGLAAAGTWLVARRRPVLLALALGALAAYAAAQPGSVFALRLRSLFVIGPASSAMERLSLWRSGLRMVRDRPLAGVTGKRRFQQELYESYRQPGGWYPEPRAGHVHNSLLQTAVLHGVPGLGLLLWWLAALWRSAWRLRPPEPAGPAEGPPGSAALLARALPPLLLAVFVNAQFDFVLGHGGQHSIVFYALAGQLLGARRRPGSRQGLLTAPKKALEPRGCVSAARAGRRS